MNDILKDIEKLSIDPEGIVEDIDVAEIEDEAQRISFALCKNLREVYFDDTFMQQNPKLKERLDVELESLRVLIKMRKSNEIVHDLCLRSIGLNANNASLYKALTGIQGSLLSIQKQMDDTIKNINSLLKNVQLEFDFNNENKSENDSSQNESNINRGTKSFIQKMKEEMLKNNEERN